MSRSHRVADSLRVVRIGTCEADQTYYVFDLDKRRLVRDVVDYLESPSIRDLDIKTREKLVYHLVRPLEFLRRRGGSLHEITNELLREYRDWELEVTKEDRSYRGSVRTAKKTVNSKMDNVLLWLRWLQTNSGIDYGHLTLPFLNDKGRLVSVRKSSPAYFKGVGVNSKHRSTMLPPTEQFDAALEDAVSRPLDDYAACRNGIFGQLARSVGLRLESLTSLRTEQFFGPEVRQVAEGIIVVPDLQKFDFDNEFLVPAVLVEHIRGYVESERRNLILTKNQGVDLSEDRLFLSARTAKPLTGRAVSAIFGRAMRGAGFPKGSSVHAFRKEFGTKEAEHETLARLHSGLDTSSLTIAKSVSLRLGQSSAESSAPYVLQQQTSLGRDALRSTLEKAQQVRTDLAAAVRSNEVLTSILIEKELALKEKDALIEKLKREGDV